MQSNLFSAKIPFSKIQKKIWREKKFTFSNERGPFTLTHLNTNNYFNDEQFRYNHRIQVLDPAGRFLRAFGSQGTTDGKFNYPWGITTDSLGIIYVCDKENHRIQV